MLRLHLLLSRPYYEPGGNVVSTVQVYNDPEAASAAPIRIRELVFLSAGFERTDANWISRLYRPEAAIELTDARKGVRTLFRTDGAMLMRNWELQMGAAHQFTVKFRLPGDLPPTFRGSSIRFNYTVDVKALYETGQGQPAPSTPPPLYETTATTSLLVWPTPTTWGSIMLKRQPSPPQQQQQQQQQLQQPPTQASQASPFSSRTDTTTGAGRCSPATDGPTADPAGPTLSPSPSTPAPPNSKSTVQQKGHLPTATAPPSEGDAAQGTPPNSNSTATRQQQHPPTALAPPTLPEGDAAQGTPPNSNSTTTQQQQHPPTALAPPTPPEGEPSQGVPPSADGAAATAPAPSESNRPISAAAQASAESNRSTSAAAPALAESCRLTSAAVPAPSDSARSLSASPADNGRLMSAAPAASSRSMSAAAAVGSSILKGPLKVFAPCAPQVLPSAATPLTRIAESGEDDSSDVVQPLLAPSLGGSQQFESTSTSRCPSISGNVSLLRQNSSNSSSYGVGAQGSGVVGVARTADDMDVPCLEYALQRSVRAKFRKVPVDAALLKGGVAAFGMGIAPLPPPAPSSSLPPSLQHAAPTTGASTRGATVGSGQSSTPHATATRPEVAQQSNGGPAGEHGQQYKVQGSKLADTNIEAPPPLLALSQQLSYSAAHANGTADSTGEEGWSDSDSDGEEAEALASSPHTKQRPGGPLSSKGHQKPEPSLQRPVGSYSGTSSTSAPPTRPQQFGRLFVLNAGEHPVLKITLQAPLDTPLQPGATFGGLLDLRPAGLKVPYAVRCNHLAVMLETEEVIDSKHQPHKGSSTGGGGAIRRLHCEHQEITTDLHLTHFVFSIPASGTPSFRTPMVGLRWVLRFELAVGRPPDAHGGQHQMQLLTWALPLIVQAPG